MKNRYYKLTLSFLLAMILLSAASTSFAEKKKQADIFPTDKELLSAASKIYRMGNEPKVIGKWKDRDGTYLIFIDTKRDGITSRPLRLYKLDTGTWVMGIYEYEYQIVK